MPDLFVDGRKYSYRDEHANLLAVCLSLGLDLPYFCWHPALGSVGACRQCAVKLFADEADTRGRLVMACMTAPVPGMRISLRHPDAVSFREGITEWLMVNHPHDCPVCDEGGECHLQDMTVMTGHSYRRYRFKKRTHRNQYLGPFINHEMNRCIECYRCVRFYRDYAGGKDLDVFGWHDHVYFGRFEEGALESEFSGNLVEICPTGVFTDKTLKKHYTRKWDLQTAPSICTGCSLGCNIIPGEREGSIRRVYSRYSSEVNGYFLCDRGRFGYEYNNSPKRVREPRVRDGSSGAAPAGVVDADAAVAAAAKILRSGRCIAIGSPRASLESNFALRRLVGEKSFFHGTGRVELELMRRIKEILESPGVVGASTQEASRCDAVLVLGEDVANAAPLLALNLRQAAFQKPARDAQSSVAGIAAWDDAAVREIVRGRHGPFAVATPMPTKLDELADVAFRALPSELALLAFASAHAIDPSAPEAAGAQPETLEGARRIAELLTSGERPIIVSGTSCGSEALIEGAANLSRALRSRGIDARLLFVLPEANSMGIAMMAGDGIEGAVEAVRSGGVAGLFVLENDLTRRLTSRDADALFGPADGGSVRRVCFDFIENETNRGAEILLPAATLFEGDGTFVNNEGRAQRAVQVYDPPGATRESWRWIGALSAAAGVDHAGRWMILESVQAELAASLPGFSELASVLPAADLAIAGLAVPRLSHRASGRTALVAGRTIHEPPPPEDPDNAMTFSMEGYAAQVPAPLTARYWAPGWNSVQSLNKFQIEVAGLLKGTEGDRMLLKPGAGPAAAPYFGPPTGAAAPFRAGRSGETSAPRGESSFELCRALHIHGSDELALHSPGVAELSPEPYVGLCEADAAEVGAAEGTPVIVTVGSVEATLPVRVVAGLAPGVALYPLGIAGVPVVELPGRAVISAVSGRAGGSGGGGAQE